MIAILKFELNCFVLTISKAHYSAPLMKIKSNAKKNSQQI